MGRLTQEELANIMNSDTVVIYNFLISRKTELKEILKYIEEMEKPIPQDTKEYYRHIKEKIEFLDEEIQKNIKE